MPRIEYSVDTDVPAEKVYAAITDFSDDRPRLWPNISRKFYEVHERGENWTEATEGSDLLGGIWARERYEWSPGYVKATVVDSNIFKSGIWEMRVESREGGGSHVEVVNHRNFKGKGLILVPLLKLAGASSMKKDLQKTLDVVREGAAESAAA